MNPRLLRFSTALEQSENWKRHILLGNGFSAAWDREIFSYSSIKERAKNLTEDSKKVFDALDTVDFEEVIRALEYAEVVNDALSKPNNFGKLAAEVRESLIGTIAASHPDLPSRITEDQFNACVDFLSNFTRIFTLNYDMLLYWVLMRDMFPEEGKPKLKSKTDGFAYNDEDFLNWDGSSAHVHYMHGALHLFEETQLQKLNYRQTARPLKEQYLDLIRNKGKLPLFVAEGSSDRKMIRIRNSGYLTRSLNSLQKMGSKTTPNALFTYGVSFSENDDHIIKALAHSHLTHFYVGVYGDPASDKNQKTIAQVRKIEQLRDAKKTTVLRFFSADSAKPWG